jgi:hypothetical protein
MQVTTKMHSISELSLRLVNSKDPICLKRVMGMVENWSSFIVVNDLEIKQDENSLRDF